MQSFRKVIAIYFLVPLAIPTAIASDFSAMRDLCLVRTYTDSHLAKHPDQMVTEMRLVHRPSGYSSELKQETAGPNPSFFVAMDVTFRGSQKRYSQGVVCFPDSDPAFCGVECDGGRFTYRFKSDGALLVDFRSTGGMALEADCGEGDIRWIGDHGDDKLFRVDPAPMSACVGLGED